MGSLPRGSLSRRVSIRGSLSTLVSLSSVGYVQGVSGGFCPEGSLSGRSLSRRVCPWVSVQGFFCPVGSLSGGLCPEVSVLPESLS